jgi:D-glycero-beta-D-manno-heptose 1-phosphate adenylyltransferase
MRYPQRSWNSFSKTKIFPSLELEQLLQEQREIGKTIATLNGSFDLLHAGHLYILYEASQTADILVVALNTDASVKRYKSPSRPIIHLQERMEMVAALGMVDYVTWFDEDDPRTLLRLIRPDVHVNGAEYGQNCIEAGVVRECGGRVHLVDRIPGLATSQILSTIRNLCEEYGPQPTEISLTTSAKSSPATKFPTQ